MPLIAPKALSGLYFFCEPLAEGSFGILYLAIHAITKQKVAIKILDKRKLGADAFRVRSEIEALKQLNHRYIYRLYQVIETESYFYLVVEYLPGGELFDYILQKQHLSEPEARIIFRQVVSAIGYIHTKGFAHRDLKPNVTNAMLNTFCGSFAYAAPEVLANKEYCGSAADLWSLGVILYALLCGCLPYDPTKPKELARKIGKGVFTVPDTMSKSARHLLAQLMCVDPKKRIRMDDLCRHPWMLEGYGGQQPVDVSEELIPMHPLNTRIVSEISEYTHIPKVEMARMLQRRSYDYLMATYLIMETTLEDERVFLRLPCRRRGTGEPANRTRSQLARPPNDLLPPPAAPPLSSKSISHGTVNGQPSPALRLPTPLGSNLSNNKQRSITSNGMSDDHRRSFTRGFPFREPSGRSVDQQQQTSSHSSTARNENCPPTVSLTDTNRDPLVQKTTFATPSTGPPPAVRLPDALALSPSRSIDSQLLSLTQNLHATQLSDASSSLVRSECAKPTLDACFMSDSLNNNAYILTTHHSQPNHAALSSTTTTSSCASPSSLPMNRQSRCSTRASSNLARSTGSVGLDGDVDGEENHHTGSSIVSGSADPRIAPSGSGGSAGWRRFRDALLTPKKPQSVDTSTTTAAAAATGVCSDASVTEGTGGAAGIIGLGRLRKARHRNNVFLVRSDLTSTQVLDRIAIALHQQPLRFTLKGPGFLCVFENDWGKTVLSFELELVQVAGRTVTSMSHHTLSIKRRMTLKPRPNTNNNSGINEAAHTRHVSSTPSSPARLTLTPRSNHSPVRLAQPRLDRSSREASNNSVGSTGQKHADSVQSQQLGIKIKRLRGDSFMYTSLCRTILELADVRASGSD